jgi:hypothetical protein
MARRFQQADDLIGRAQSALARLAESPLAEVAGALQRALNAASNALSDGSMSSADVAALTQYILTITDRLPQAFQERFWFDAALIHGLRSGWSEQPLFSAMLVPAYDKDWGYTRLVMPLSEPANAQGFHHHILELIFFPRGADLREISLLEYPWLAHELAHSLMFRHDEALIPRVEPALARVIRRRRLAAAADRDRPRTIALNAIDELQMLWRPTHDHRNWTHEISADLIAASLLGPVYFSAFADVLDGDAKNPYQISPGHPPYALRVTALKGFAQRLGFPTKDLERLEDAWATSRWRSQKNNKLVMLADSELVDGIVEGVQDLCNILGLRPWNAGRATEMGATIKEHTPSLGPDLLTAAWLAFNELGEQQYAAWEQKIIQAHLECLMP